MRFDKVRHQNLISSEHETIGKKLERTSLLSVGQILGFLGQLRKDFDGGGTQGRLHFEFSEVFWFHILND